MFYGKYGACLLLESFSPTTVIHPIITTNNVLSKRFLHRKVLCLINCFRRGFATKNLFFKYRPAIKQDMTKISGFIKLWFRDT